MTALLVGLLVPAAPVPKETPPPPPTPAQWSRAEVSLKDLGLALHSHNDTFDRLPSDVRSKDGKPLLSWRVSVLPFLGDGDALYKRFKLDEPWDSEHNAKLIEKMPKLFAPVRAAVKPGHTFLQGPAGPGTVFDPKNPKLTVQRIRDGSSNTAGVVQAGDAVPWTKPADVPFDPAGPLPKLGGEFDGAFVALLMDGTVKRIRKDADPQLVKWLFQTDDGRVISFEAIELPRPGK